MGRWIVPLLAVCGAVLPSAAVASSPSTPGSIALDDGSPPPAECVEASQEDHPSRDDALVLKLDNGCSVTVHCSISWVVRCKDGKEHPFSRTANLAAGASQSFEASASVCSEAGWRITPPKWECGSK
jgi:hypothetical protein